MPSRKRKATKGHSGNESKKAKLDQNFADYVKKVFLPVVIHNLKQSYDAHFVLKHFKKQYTERRNESDVDNETTDDMEETYGDIQVTPLNSEKYLQF